MKDEFWNLRSIHIYNAVLGEETAKLFFKKKLLEYALFFNNIACITKYHQCCKKLED